MEILNKNEMLNMPSGTVFMLYEPYCTGGTIHIKTDDGKWCDNKMWTGELILEPFMNLNAENDKKMTTEWCTTDQSSIDYDEDQLFAVFSKAEIDNMIRILQWAYNDLEAELDQDIIFNDDNIIDGETNIEIDSNSYRFCKQQYFDINKPVRCLCGELLYFPLKSTHGEEIDIVCDVCKRAYTIIPKLNQYKLIRTFKEE